METSRSEQDYAELIADAREWPRDGVNEGPLINALADAIEALVKERDDLKREMHARELHHFEEEQKSAELAAVIERALYMSDGQNMARALGEAPADALREHDAALIESLAEARRPFSQAVSGSTDPNHVPTMHTRFAIDYVGRSWLRERARQVREGEA